MPRTTRTPVPAPPTRTAAQAAHAALGYQLRAPREPGDKWVTMSNALTRAGHGLTLPEKRMIMCAVAQLDSCKRIPYGEVLRTKITASDYAELFDLDPNSAYEQLKNGAKVLYSRSVTFFEAAHKRGGKDLVKVQMRWIGSARYQEGEAWVELAWWPDLLPHLVGLRQQFTSYQLKQASALRSVYSWRLLELLMRFEGTGWAEYTIEDFCASMEASEKTAADFGKIRTKIIEPAIKELTQKDGWLIEYKTIKRGRKVTGLRFEFGRNPQQSLEL